MANLSDNESEEQDAEADDSSMEYAGDLNVSDDEATLEEEEVNSNPLGTVQAFSQETCGLQHGMRHELAMKLCKLAL